MRLVTFLALALLSGCAGCHKPVDPPLGTSIVGPVEAPPKTTAEAVDALVYNFSRVQFAYDSASLDGEARAALAANAAILQKFPEIRVEVQGHADERGTIDYNLALGERRARVVVDELTRLGAPIRGLSTVSYGEERPLAAGSSETAWSQNRRAEFRIVAGAPGVTGSAS